MVMKRSMLWAVSAAIVGLSVAALRCNSLLGSSVLTSEPCTENCGPCTAYCNAIMQSCPSAAAGGVPKLGPLTEYLTTDICLRTCSVNSSAPDAAATANWYQAVGETQNAFECRQGQASDAGTPSSCTSAGPLGGATCVSPTADPCATFCLLDLQICTGINQQYASAQVCEDYCKGRMLQQSFYALDGGSGSSDLSPHKDDDTLNCRFYHLENAMLSAPGFGPDIHCPHTGYEGGLVCVPPATDAGEVDDAAYE
jgi:hypothetical protein